MLLQRRIRASQWQMQQRLPVHLQPQHLSWTSPGGRKKLKPCPHRQASKAAKHPLRAPRHVMSAFPC